MTTFKRISPRALLALLFINLTAVPTALAIDHSMQIARLTSDSTQRRGGSGGFSYNLSCASGQVLIGVAAHAASWVDNVSGICIDVTATGNWSGASTTTAAAGGPGGSAATRTCPSDFAISGFSGRAGGLIERLVLECTRLGPNGTFNTSVARQTLSAIGGTGGTAFSLSRCTNPARAIVGKSGAFVDSIEFGCEDSSPLMTSSQIDAALAGATNILRTDSGSGDVAADVRLLRSGRTLIQPSNGLFDIGSSDELDAACGLTGFGVVTSSISFCSGLGSSIVGCAKPGCLIVVPVSGASSRDQLWAHEFGHTRALPHRSGTGLVMNPSLNGGTLINIEERDAYTNPVTAFFFSFLSAEDSGPPAKDVQEFIARSYIHGVPYEQAAAFGPAAVPELIAALRDARREASWSIAATTLAIIGEPVGVDAVIEFIRDPGAGDMTPERAWARGNAVLSLGYAANKGNPRALQYLAESLDPAAWARRGARGARNAQAVEPGEEPESSEDQLSERAAFGLALSGRPEARAALESRLRGPGSTAGQLRAFNMALAEHAKIAGRGLRGYDEERRARAVDRAAAAQRAERARGAPPRQ